MNNLIKLFLSFILMFSAFLDINALDFKLDILAHYSRRITSPPLNIIGPELRFAIDVLPPFAVETYAEFDYYTIFYNDDTSVHKDIHFGAGIRYYVTSQFQLRAVAGHVSRLYSNLSGNGVNKDLRYGGGVSYVHTMESFLLNLGADFYHYRNGAIPSSSGADSISVHAGITFEL